MLCNAAFRFEVGAVAKVARKHVQLDEIELGFLDEMYRVNLQRYPFKADGRVAKVDCKASKDETFRERESPMLCPVGETTCPIRSGF